MYVYIILYQGQVSMLGFDSEDKAFEYLEKEKGAKQEFGYKFEDGYEIREVKIV